MEVVFRTFDNQIFTDAKAAMEHEKTLENAVRMFDREGVPTMDTNQAYAVCLMDETAADTFIRMCKAQDDEYTLGIESEDMGIFLYDEWEGCYKYFDRDSTVALESAIKAWNAKG